MSLDLEIQVTKEVLLHGMIGRSSRRLLVMEGADICAGVMNAWHMADFGIDKAKLKTFVQSSVQHVSLRWWLSLRRKR